MAANTAPIYSLTPVTAMNAAITTANTAVDGSGSVTTLFTAGSAGGYCQFIRGKALGACTASVLRVFINDATGGGSGHSQLFTEMPLPTTSASNLAVIGPDITVPINIALPASYTITCCIGTTVSAGWVFLAVAGSY
jgi:hypothetical protein